MTELPCARRLSSIINLSGLRRISLHKVDPSGYVGRVPAYLRMHEGIVPTYEIDGIDPTRDAGARERAQ